MTEGFFRKLSTISHQHQRKTVSKTITQKRLRKACARNLPYETLVKGIFYDNCQEVAQKAKVNESVNLVRDYQNKFDHNAIKVCLNNKELVHGFKIRGLVNPRLSLQCPPPTRDAMLKAAIANQTRTRSRTVLRWAESCPSTIHRGINVRRE